MNRNRTELIAQAEELSTELAEVSAALEAQDEAIRHRRLTTLRSIINTGPEHFDMNNWAVTPEGNAVSLSSARRVDPSACGTTACLAGHCVIANTEEVVAAYGVDFRDIDIADFLGFRNAAPFFTDRWPSWLKVFAWDVYSRSVTEKEFYAVKNMMAWFVKNPRATELPDERPDGFTYLADDF